jgi:amidohydrolase
MNEKLIELRQYLHMNPELPGEEDQTASHIASLLESTRPDKLWTGVGGKGVVAFYHGNKQGKRIAVRAELDALPITESNEFSHKSRREGVAHSCGHDGHMAIVMGIAEKVAKRRDSFAGSIAVIFQPEEETGTGAAKMLADERLKKVKFDYVLALHNLPGYERHSLIIRKGTFTSTTTGMIIRLWGATSHAGHPENGNSPIMGMTAIMNSLNSLPQQCIPVHRAALLTIIHACLGEIAFGTTPGYAHIMATMRCHEAEDLEKMKEQAVRVSEGIAQAYGLRHEIEWVEYYPAMINDERLADEVIETAGKLDLPVIQRDNPFSWSEDFSYFAQQTPGVLFGLGAGLNHPQLHNDNYDFPDELIATGISIFDELLTRLTGEQ